jgi:hypothetical protein
MPNFIDLTGRRFGKLKVIKRAGTLYCGAAWQCACDCGGEVVVGGPSLRNGKTGSCGCLRASPDLLGMKVGRLKVVGRAPNIGFGVAWRCVCECGRETDVRSTDLTRKSGAIQSCGCGHARNIIGKKFASLTVVKRNGSTEAGVATWLCKCDCGADAVANASSLRLGTTVSCGCKRTLPNNGSARNGVELSYRQGARKRGHAYDLPAADFDRITAMDCDYCGGPPANVRKCWNSMFIYSGIDRKDNAKGYTLENCVPCCAICNMTKGKRSAEEFRAWIDRLVGQWQKNRQALVCEAA